MGVDSPLPQAPEPPAPVTADVPGPRTNPWLWLVLLVFAAAGAVRAVPFHILTPDSGDYLIAARSLVTGNGYRDLSTVGDPPFTWRPPGVAVLLMPAAALGADCSSYAKWLTVLYGVVLLWCLYQYARRLVGPDWGLLPVLFVAASPQMLVYSTEVLSEVPFTASLLALLCLAEDWESGRSSAWRAVGIGLLLIALPMLRTVGAPIVGVWLLWSLTARRRLLLLFPALAAVGSLIAWSVYNRTAGGARYDSLITEVLRAEGPFKFLLAGFVNLLTYMTELNHELFPGLKTDSFVDLVTDRLFPPLFGPQTNDLLPVCGTLVLVGAAAGLTWGRGAARALTALTLGAYLAAVCLYPLRSERLLWPLIPVLWTLFVGGILSAAARVTRGASVPRRFSLIACIVLLAVAATELRDWPGMLRTSWRYWTQRSQFYAAADYPGYFADWRSAAGFLHEHAHSTDTVMTMIKEFYTVSGRRQVRLEFGRAPAEMAEMIAANRTRWLVISYGYSRRAMGRLLWHPRYKFALRYPRHSDFEIYEVLPNREGVIPDSIVELAAQPEAAPDAPLWDQARLAFRRRDFAACATHLRTMHESSSTLASHLLLARAEARRGAHDDARLCYRRMRLLESNESFASEIVAGVREVEILEELERPATTGARRAALGVELATIHCEWGRFDEAWELIESLKRSLPESGEIRAMEGHLLDWMGRAQQAEDAFAAAVKLGNRAAEELLLTRRWARALAAREAAELCAGALHEFVDPDDPRSAVQLAARWRKEGLHGRSLAVLEQAAQRFPRTDEVEQALTDARDYFGLRSDASAVDKPEN